MLWVATNRPLAANGEERRGMKRCLSISGGGIRGYLSIQALVALEARTGKRCTELFDLICGNSTGSIIAIGLHFMTAQQLSEFYADLGPAIFATSIWRKVQNLVGLSGPLYDAAVLEKALQKAFGAATPMPANCIATAYDTTSGSPVELTGAGGWKAWQCARASAAAPYYFSAFEGPDGHAYWDGGIYANSPALAAISCMGWEPNECLVLSIGTGCGPSGNPAAKVLKWKPLEFAIPLLSACMDASAAQQLRSLDELSRGMLHLDIRLNNLALDDASASNMAALKAAGEQMVASNKAALDTFLTRLLAG